MSEFVFVPLCFIIFVIILLTVYNNVVVVKKYNLSSKKLGTSLRIVLVSDYHNKHYSKDGQKIIKKIADQNPDIIVVAGDLVDRRRPNFEIARTFLSAVSKIADTYYVTGNHERTLGKENVVKKLDCSGVLVDDEYKIFEHYSLLGLHDSVGESDYSLKDLLCIFERLENYKIAVVHRPLQFDEYLRVSDYDVDLVLCGHTHGGLIRIPFFGAVVSPDEGFFPKYTKGVYTKNNTTMVVSGGLGNTFLPLRINNFPEIVVIEINN